MRNSKKIRLFALMLALALALTALPLYSALADADTPTPTGTDTSSPTPTAPATPTPAPTSLPKGDGHIYLLQEVSDEEKSYLQTQSAYAGDKIEFYVPIINKNLDSATDLSCTLPVPSPANADAYPFASAPSINPEKTWDSINSQVTGWDGKVLAIGDRAYFKVSGTLLSTATAGTKTLYFIVKYNGTMTDVVKVDIEVREKSSGGSSGGGGGGGYKTKPKVILESYSFSEDTIYAGDTVTLRLVIANTSKREAIANLTLELANEAGVILPAPGGSNSIYIGTIDKDDAYVLSLKLQVAPDADPKSQLLSIKLSYEGTKNRSAFDETASVSIPVQQKARVVINDPKIYDDPWVGGNVAVGVTLYNLGKTILYNCMVDVVGEGVTLEESYFGGNIAAGGTMRADLNVTPTVAGQLDAKVRVTYEDVNGKSTEELLPMSMFVNEEPAGDMASPGNGGVAIPGDTPASANIGWIFWTLGGVAVATGAVFLGIKAKKKRERALEEE
jgi:hypothetical protein